MDPRQLRCAVVPVRLDPPRRLGGSRLVAGHPAKPGPAGRPRGCRRSGSLPTRLTAAPVPAPGALPMNQPARCLWPALIAAALLAFTPAPGGAAASLELANLCDEYWQGYLKAHPVSATAIGDRRYDDRLEDITPAGITKEVKRLEGLLAHARAISPKGLNAADRLNLTALTEELESQLSV